MKWNNLDILPEDLKLVLIHATSGGEEDFISTGFFDRAIGWRLNGGFYDRVRVVQWTKIDIPFDEVEK